MEGVEVFRLIMGLRLVNRLVRSISGDISSLPSWAGTSPYVIDDNEVVMMSSEDIRCFSYPLEYSRIIEGTLPSKNK